MSTLIVFVAAFMGGIIGRAWIEHVKDNRAYYRTLSSNLVYLETQLQKIEDGILSDEYFLNGIKKDYPALEESGADMIQVKASVKNMEDGKVYQEATAERIRGGIKNLKIRLKIKE